MFKEINWFCLNNRFLQCSLSSIYNFYKNLSPEYFDKMYCPTEPCKLHTHSSF